MKRLLVTYRKVIGWGVINRVIGLLVGFGSIFLINHIFGKEVYGEFAFFQSVFVFIIIFSTLGLDKTIIYKVSHFSEKRNALIGKGLVKDFTKKSLLCLLLLELSLFFLWMLLWQEKFKNDFYWMATLGVAAFFSVTIILREAFFQANKFADTAIKFEVASGIIRIIILGVIFLIAEDSLQILSVYFIVPLAAMLGFYRLKERSVEKNYPAITEPKSDAYWAYSLRLMLTKVTHQGIEKTDLLMVGIFLPVAAVAEYAVAAKLALLVPIGNALLAPLFAPRLKFMIEKGQSEAVKREYNYNKYFSILAGGVVVLIFLFFGKQILSIFGDYETSQDLLLLLSLAFFNQIAFGPNGRYLMLKGYASAVFTSTVVLLFLMVSLNLLLIPLLGALGAVLGTLFSLLALNIVLQLIIYRKDGTDMNGAFYYAFLMTINFSVVGVIFVGKS